VSPPKISESSKRIIENQKIEVFKKIFAELDCDDKDNVITANEINLQGLSIDTIKILKPVFEELEYLEDGID
jgi:hypothetical protein